MKIRIIILVSLALVLIFGSYMFVKQTQTAFKELKEQLQAMPAPNEMEAVIKRYEALNQRLEEVGNHELMRTSLLSAYAGYVQTTFVIDESYDLLIDSVAVLDEASGTITTPDELEKNTRYWMGSEPTAHEGAGNGRARYLHTALNGWVKQLRDLNEEHDVLTLEGELFLPDYFEYDGGDKTWEAHTFEAPLIANMAMLESLKYQINETFSQELAFIEHKLPSIPPETQ